MGAIPDLSGMINRQTGGNSGSPEPLWFHRNGRRAGAAAATLIAGRWTSLWTHDGQPSAGVAPGAVAIPTDATAGGLRQTDPGGGREKWLLGGGAAGLAVCTVILYDRLLHIGGLSGTVTTAQTVGGTLTRYTGGLGNFILAEIYTQIGATGTTITASYTDEGSTSGNTTPATAIGATNLREAERLIWLPLAAGDRGVQAVASVTLAATTGTAGDFGVTVAHPLAFATVGQTGLGTWRSFIDGHGIPEIETDACLALAYFCGAVAVAELFGTWATIEA